ncbi:type II secretion system protein E [Thermodesulfatator indicus DSM 15286]|uniref:Type II secretion system protein E n=1 Tax=Thermodesulfatator indicus (strain DSM 15286 / JCM 11887 / CIR29812) TaxID=667014 RepID=F8AAM0_THEID|nr:ATPase, T2SS/T4P/T4SS family [Thermodesulfatator indicus]AEH44292.1 type II secretion system protein E [Thermodesulfatator indicus DSM 15286]
MSEINVEQIFKEAEVYASQGLYDEAILALEVLLSQYEEEVNQNGFKEKVLERIEELEELKKQKEQEEDLNIEIETSEEEALQEAQVLKEGGFYEAALEVFENLLNEGSQNPEVYRGLAECLLELGRYDEAISTIKMALEIPDLILDDLAALYYLLGRAYESVNKIKEALDAYNKAYHYNTHYLDVAEKIEKLKALQEKFGRLQLLFAEGLLDEKTYEEAKQISQDTGNSLEFVLIENFGISKFDIGRALTDYYGYPFIEFNELNLGPKPSCLTGIKESFFKQNICIPIEEDDERIILLIDDPSDSIRLDLIRQVLKAKKLEIKIGIKEDIFKFIDYFFGKSDFDLPEDLSELEVVEEEEDQEVTEEELSNSVVVQLVNHILEEAYRKGASDIHIESYPGKRGAQVRYRIDGECHLVRKIPYTLKRPLISRIKIMANLDIAEKRLPQDGKIKFRLKNGRYFEVRVATIPTIENNEDVVMRILASVEAMPLDKLGLREENLEAFKKLLQMPYGLILVVGPTGSGKTTTLHAALGYINTPNKKIWTAEDPVEIVQEGLRQVQVKPKIGLDFAKVLRSFLRADPDIIMIGETRDEETARTVIEASLTGHLVFTTLHTNSAPETVTRLLGMGMDPYNFADALLGILAQRLAKRLCPNCKQPYQPSEEEIELLIEEYGDHPTTPLTKEAFKEAALFKPKGCSSCNNTGYKGRLAIHELLVANDEIRQLIIKNAPVHEIREAAMRAGMLTLKQDGIWKVLQGLTDLKQIRAVSIR